MLNELNHEDALRALECCKEYENDDCPEHCPLYECESCNMPLFVTLLREKDAEIKGLVDGWSKDQDRFEQVYAEKDAEIARLTINMNAYGLTAKNLANDFADYQADVKMDIAAARAEAITEFAERLKANLIKPEFPWDDFYITECQIDQIAKELKGEQE